MKKLLRELWQAVAGGKAADKRRRSGDVPNPAAGDAADSRPVEAAFEEAMVAHQSGRLSEAQAAYARILQVNPDHAPALHFLGVSYSQTGDLPQAETLIRRSIAVEERPEYFSNLAMVLDRQGRRDEAIGAAADALRLAPDHAGPCVALADLLVAAGKPKDAEPHYRNALRWSREEPEIWFKLGLVLSGLNQVEGAAEAYRQVLALDGGHALACNNLANLLLGMKAYDDAEAMYRRALQLEPANVAVYCNLARLFHERGDLGRAEAECRHALSVQEGYAPAHNILGTVLLKAGRNSEAESACRQATILKPDFPEAWINLGMILASSGRDEEAEDVLRRAMSVCPGNPVLHHNLAQLLVKKGDLAGAEPEFRRALELGPDDAEAMSNFASMLQDGGRLKEAEPLHRKAVALRPDSALIQYNFGRLLFEAGQLGESEQAFSRVLQLKPDVAEAYDSVGTVFRDLGRFAEAEAAYEKAIALNPGNAATVVNLGSVLQALERYVEAETCYRRALTLDAGFDLAHYNLGLLCLAQQRLEEGWSGYERRWNLKGFNLRRHQAPQLPWNGELVRGESLLLWQEQGIGDTLLYAGMVPDLIESGMDLIVECEPRLVPLFQRSFPTVRVVASNSPPHTLTRQARWQSPFGSLCRELRRNRDHFPRRGAYIIPDADRVAAFRQRYRAMGNGPVIGISWRSNNPKVGLQKSLQLKQWASMLKLPNVVLVNLQYGDCREELSRLENETGVRVYQDPLVDSMKDLDAFSAQVAAMDLVISTSNSTVHFAGASGAPVWMLLPRGGTALLWYWFLEGHESPWYPGLRIFRQEVPGDWDGTVLSVADALGRFVDAFSKDRESATSGR